MFKVTISALALALTASGLAGCATGQLPPSPSISHLEDLSAVPAPDALTMFERVRPYRIGPLDLLSYTVFGVDGLNGQLQVDSGGKISIPLAGSLTVAGKTPEEVSDEVAEALRAAHVRDPQVVFNAVQINSQFVTVEGQVIEPGNYAPVPNMTLLRAIAQARGLNDVAKADHVMIFRTVAGQEYAAIYNLKAIRQGAAPDPEVYSYDRVVVGSSATRRFIKDLAQIGPVFTTPLVYVLTR